MTDFQKQDFYASFQQFKEKIGFLQGLYSETEQIFKDIDQPIDAQILHKGHEKLQSDTFKVLVIGEFKRGKSTFLNALMGEEILPAFSIPCTAVINEIKWSEEKYAILHFENPLPPKMPHKLAPDVQKHLDCYKGKEVPPMRIPFDRLEEFVTIPDPGKDHAQSVFESPFKLVELFYPLEICRNNIDLIDSPGLNEHKSRTDVTVNYLAQADAIIFVLSCEALCSMSEMEVIDNTLWANGYEDIFFVINRFDAIRDREKPKIIKYAEDKLLDKTSLGRRGLHFVSSLGALDAKLDNKPEDLEKSGFPELENDLNTFLIKDRGRIKLLRPSRELRRLLSKGLIDVIPQQEAMLTSESQELEKRYSEAKPKLSEAEKRRSMIRERLALEKAELERKVRKEVIAFMNDTIEEIPVILDNYEPENTFKFLSVQTTKAQAEAIFKECTEYVSNVIDYRRVEWEEKSFKPLMEASIQNMTDKVKGNMDDFYRDLFEVRQILAGSEAENIAPKTDPWERVLAAAGGLFLGDIGSGLVGGMMGMTEMVKSLIPNIIAGTLLIVLGFTNPLIWIPALLSVGGVQAWLGGGAMGKKIKSNVGVALQKHIKDQLPEIVETVAENIDRKMQELLDNINLGLQNEIQNITDSIEAILQVVKSGQEDIEHKRTLLAQTKERLKKLQTGLNDFMDDI